MQVQAASTRSKMTITVSDHGVLRLITDTMDRDRADSEIHGALLDKMFPASLDAVQIATVNSSLDLNGALAGTDIAGVESCLIAVDGPIDHAASDRAHGVHMSVLVGLVLSPEMDGAHELLENFHLPPDVIGEAVGVLVDQLMATHGEEFGLFDRTGWLRQIELQTDGAWEPIAFQTESLDADGANTTRRRMDLAAPLGAAVASGPAW